MTLNQLRSFGAVAATGSVRQAATALYVSAPAVSAAVGALESELGLPLVSRGGRALELTPAGVIFARYARQVLGPLEEGIAATAAQLHPELGRVRLAATTAGEHVVPRPLVSFRRRYPDADVMLDVGNRSRVLATARGSRRGPRHRRKTTASGASSRWPPARTSSSWWLH